MSQGENAQQDRKKRCTSKVRKATQCGYCGEVAGHTRRTCPQNPDRKKKTPPSSNSRSKKKARNAPNTAADANPINSDSEHGSKDKDSDGDDEKNERRRTEYLDPGLIEDRLAENLEQTGNDDPDDPYHDEKWAYEDVIEHPKIHTRETDEVDAPFQPSTSKTYAGSRNIPPEIMSQGQFLDLLFTGDIIQHFVENTNSFVSRQLKPAWLPKDNVDATELKRFFGTILYMGIVQRPELKRYWEKSHFGDPYVKKLFRRDRFLDILYNLHWFDASEISDEERQRRNREDGFWVIEDIQTI